MSAEEEIVVEAEVETPLVVPGREPEYMVNESPKILIDDGYDSQGVDKRVLSLLDGTKETAGTDETKKVEPEVVKQKETPTAYSQKLNEFTEKERGLTERESKIKEKEESFSESERRADVLLGLQKRLKEGNPIDFLVESFGSTDEAEIQAFLFRAQDYLTARVLGEELPQEYQEDQRYRDLERKFEAKWQEESDRRLAAEKTAKDAQTNTQLVEFKSKITAELNQGDFNYLKAQEEKSPTEVVYEYISWDYQNQIDEGKLEPTPLTVEKAAVEANNYYKAKLERAYEKYEQLKKPSAPQETDPWVPRTRLTNNYTAPSEEVRTLVGEDTDSLRQRVRAQINSLDGR